MREELAPWVAFGLALALVPVVAFSTGEAPRDTRAQVVDDADAYVASSTHWATLNASNGYEDDAVTVTHRYVPDTTLRLHVNNTATDPRFAFVNSTFTLEASGSHTLQVEDTDAEHPTGTFTVTAEVEATVRQDTDNVGHQRFETTVSVTVE